MPLSSNLNTIAINAFLDHSIEKALKPVYPLSPSANDQWTGLRSLFCSKGHACQVFAWQAKKVRRARFSRGTFLTNTTKPNFNNNSWIFYLVLGRIYMCIKYAHQADELLRWVVVKSNDATSFWRNHSSIWIRPNKGSMERALQAVNVQIQ